MCVCVCVCVCTHFSSILRSRLQSDGAGEVLRDLSEQTHEHQHKQQHRTWHTQSTHGYNPMPKLSSLSSYKLWALLYNSRSSFPLAVRTWPQWWMGKCTGQNISSKGSACAAAMYSFEAVITSCIIIHYLSKLIFCFNNSNWGFELNTTRLECLLHLGSRNSAPLTGLFFIIDSKLFEFFLVLTLRETLKELKRHLDGCVNQENQNLSFCY